MKLYQALIAGLVACSFAVAQDAATTAAPTASTEKAAPAPKAKKAEMTKSVMGTVVSVDAIANTIIVKAKKADDTISTTDKTVVMPKGKTVADLKADDKVTVSYKTEDGKMVATKIVLAPAKKAKKAAAAATTTTTTTPAAPAAPTSGEAK